MVPISTESSAGASSGASRYHVLMPVAAGGMATVELALQVSPGGFERLVALKRVKPDLSSSEEVAAMFAEESRLAARLNHPNLIHAYEVGHDQAGAFLAMEYLSGQSYEELTERVGLADLDLRVALEVLIGTLEGLECVHALRDIDGRRMGIVHRDISPSNLFLTYSGQVKVLDFGIAKAQLSSVQTQVGVVKGKVKYMAPEQALGGTVDARADLYAVGVMLWEALAREHRWGNVPDAVVTHLLSANPPPPLGAAGRVLPARAEEICMKALAYQPSERFQGAAEFRAELEILSASLGPRLSARGLADYLLDFFAGESVQTEQRVERCLADLKRGGAGHSAAPEDPSGRDSRSKINTRKLALAPRIAKHVSAVPVEGDTPVVTQPGARRLSRVLPALALVAIAIIAWLGLRLGQPASPHVPTTDAGTHSPIAAQSTARAGQAATLAATADSTTPGASSATLNAPQQGASSAVLTPTNASPRHESPAPRSASHRAAPKTAAPKATGLALDRGSPW